MGRISRNCHCCQGGYEQSDKGAAGEEDIFGGGHVERLLFGASAGYPWFGKVPRFTIIFVVEEYLKVSSTGTYLVKRSPNCKDIVEDFISFGEDIV